MGVENYVENIVNMVAKGAFISYTYITYTILTYTILTYTILILSILTYTILWFQCGANMVPSWQPADNQNSFGQNAKRRGFIIFLEKYNIFCVGIEKNL